MKKRARFKNKDERTRANKHAHAQRYRQGRGRYRCPATCHVGDGRGAAAGAISQQFSVFHGDAVYLQHLSMWMKERSTHITIQVIHHFTKSKLQHIRGSCFSRLCAGSNVPTHCRYHRMPRTQKWGEEERGGALMILHAVRSHDPREREDAILRRRPHMW